MGEDTLSSIPELPRSLFELPKRLIRPDWAGHLPFLACLLGASRPKRFVELGVFYGDSYCYACQMRVLLRMETECVGIDSWQGDIHTGNYTEDVYSDLKAHHDSRYSEFSVLKRGFFEDQVGDFDDESIDLLHIDGEHTYEAVSKDFRTWLPKVKAAGIILFHDTDVFDRSDFGVWKLWGELSNDWPTFRFNHSHGLGVLLKGTVSDVPRPFETLFRGTPEQQDSIRAFFEAVGTRYIYQAHLGRSDRSMLAAGESGSSGMGDPALYGLSEFSRINRLLSRSKLRKLRYVLSGRL